ncbi:MAG TPA: hypothetical protein DEZ08_01920 [Dehalococcoidia bacterium]|nr:hypothetical protein [Dehalococcoidia bacterium]
MKYAIKTFMLFAAIVIITLGCNSEYIDSGEPIVATEISKEFVAPAQSPDLSDKSLELLNKIEFLEKQLRDNQDKESFTSVSAEANPSPQNLNSESAYHFDSLSQIEKAELIQSLPDPDLNTPPSAKITILNYSSYSTDDINRWVALAESKMSTRKSNILAWIYPVGELILPEQEIRGDPFMKHSVILTPAEIDTLMQSIETWLKADECMGSRNRKDHLKEELNRYRMWFEEGGDASTQATLCAETRIVAIGVSKHMRENEPLSNFQNLLIHEFYHSFQQDLDKEGKCRQKMEQENSNSRWFIEGAAHYFSEKVTSEINGNYNPLNKILENAWNLHKREGETRIDGGALDKSGAVGLQLLIEKELLIENAIMDGSLFHNCARELIYDKDSPELQHVRNSWYLINKNDEQFSLMPEAYIP